MPTYTLTVTEVYKVTANSTEQALRSWSVIVDRVSPSVVGLKPEEVLSHDAYDFIDGNKHIKLREMSDE